MERNAMISNKVCMYARAQVCVCVCVAIICTPVCCLRVPPYAHSSGLFSPCRIAQTLKKVSEVL